MKQDGQFSWLSSRKRIPNVNRKFDKMAEKILLHYYRERIRIRREEAFTS